MVIEASCRFINSIPILKVVTGIISFARMSADGSIRIRPAGIADGFRVSEIYRPYVIETPISFEEIPPDAKEMENRIASITAQYPYLIAEAAGRVIGYAYACPHRVRASYRWSVDVAVYVDRDQRRRGVGRALYERLIPLIREQGYVMAYAGITVPNDASIGLHEAVGFKRVAIFANEGYKLGQWRNVGWWELALSAFPPAPLEPIPWPNLKERHFPRTQ